MASLSVLRATLVFSEEQQPKLDENNPVAQSLGYVQDTTKADTAAFPKRAGDDGAKQFCRTCQFYLGDSGSAWGGCVVFSEHLVNSGGWCNSWLAKVDS